MLLRFLQRRRERLERIRKDATNLLTFMGEPAYHEARRRARVARERRDGTTDGHWSKVAVEIARRTGRVIGGRSIDQPELVRTDPKRLATIGELVTIAEAIAALARGRENETTLHNAEAATRRLVDGPSPTTRALGDDLCRALRNLAGAPDECAAALAGGEYPRAADEAGAALERLRDVLLRDSAS